MSENLPATKTKTPKLLSSENKKLWRQHKKTVEKGAETFIEVGKALNSIFAKKLYVEDYDSFADYVADSLGISYQQGYNLKNAAVLADKLKNEEDIEVIPQNESQMRHLLKLQDYDKQKAAWKSVVKSVNEGEQITAKIVKAHALKQDYSKFEKQEEALMHKQLARKELKKALEMDDLDGAKIFFEMLFNEKLSSIDEN